jgi:hypothetical protein
VQVNSVLLYHAGSAASGFRVVLSEGSQSQFCFVVDVKQRHRPDQYDLLSGNCYGFTCVVPQNSSLCDSRRLLQSTLPRSHRLRFHPLDRSPNLLRIFFLANLGKSIFDTSDGEAAAADALSTATRSDEIGMRLS